MAIIANTFTTYDASGNREDLTSVVTNISPIDTYFTSNTGTAPVKARYHEWTTDALAAAAANAQMEGGEIAAAAITPKGRTGNYTQVIAKAFAISDTQAKVDQTGPTSPIAYHTAKTLKELARDIEYALVINAAAVTGITGTARVLCGVLGWISTNVTTAATGTTSATLTNTVVNANLQTLWSAGGDPKIALVGGFVKRTISAFTDNTKFTMADEKTLTAAVDIYQSDFGPIAIKLHRQLNTTQPSTMIILGDMDLWKKCWLEPVRTEEWARTSLARKFVISCELTLEARQEKGASKITQITNA